MKKVMKKAALKLYDRSVPSLFVLGKGVAEAMTGNANFPSPPVTPDALKAASEELEAAHITAVETRSIAAFAAERAKKAVVLNMLRQLGNYVTEVANGNEEIIISAGMPVSKTRSKHPVPGQVRDFVAEFTGVPKSILLRWRRPQYASMFRVYMSETPSDASSWVLIDTITVRKLMVENLSTGKRFFFKVVAVNAAGTGPDSEVAEALAS
jgi:hypothetical protein